MTERTKDGKTTRRFWRRLAGIVGLNLAGIVLLLAAGEIYFRARQTYIVRQDAGANPLIGFIDSRPEYLVQKTPAGKRLTPNAHVIIMNHRLSKDDIRIDTNSRGFRDRETPIEKRPGEIRVLALGDSITVGDYLPAEQVWMKQAERLLSKRFPERPLELINAGIADVGLREELDLLEEKGLELRPDWVMVGFYLNDGRPPWGFPGELGSHGFLRRHSILAQKIYEQLLLRRWVKHRGELGLRQPAEADWMPWRTRSEMLGEFIRMAEYDWGSAWSDEAWEVIDAQLDRLRRLATAKGFRVMIVCFPVKYQVYADYIEDAPQRRMEKRAAELDFEYLDVLPALRGHREKDLFFDHCHPRALANRVIGRAVADALGPLFEAPRAVPEKNRNRPSAADP